MFRSVLLLAFALLALLGPAFADCPTSAEYQKVFKKANKKILDEFKKAKTAKQCDKAMVNFIKDHMYDVNSGNAEIYVHHGLEALDYLAKNKGNILGAIKGHVKECTKEMDQAAKALGYSKVADSDIARCVMKHRELEDWDHTITWALKYMKESISDVKKMGLLVQAAMKEDIFKPLMSQIGSLLG